MGNCSTDGGGTRKKQNGPPGSTGPPTRAGRAHALESHTPFSPHATSCAGTRTIPHHGNLRQFRVAHYRPEGPWDRGGRTEKAGGRCMKPPCTGRELRAVVERRGLAGCVWTATTDTLERRWIEKVKRFHIVPLEGGRCKVFHKTFGLLCSIRPPLTGCGLRPFSAGPFLCPGAGVTASVGPPPGGGGANASVAAAVAAVGGVAGFGWGAGGGGAGGVGEHGVDVAAGGAHAGGARAGGARAFPPVGSPTVGAFPSLPRGSRSGGVCCW